MLTQQTKSRFCKQTIKTLPYAAEEPNIAPTKISEEAITTTADTIVDKQPLLIVSLFKFALIKFKRAATALEIRREVLLGATNECR